MALPKLDTPVFELKLPSTGKKIKYRPFLVREHKILLTMSEADDGEIGRIIKELVNVCTFGALKVDQLPHFDIEYIFMMLRAKSIGENVNIVVNCDCGEKIDAEFNIENIQVEKPEGHTNKIMVNEQYGIELKYPGIEKVLEVYVDDGNSKIFDLILDSIKSVYSADEYFDASEQSKEELEEFLLSLTKEQFDKLEQFYLTAPKIVQVIEADCPTCQKHNVVRLEGLQNFFV